MKNDNETPTSEMPAVEPESANREAARYRRALRATEAERDAAQALIAEAQRELLISRLPNIEVKTDAAIGTLRPEALDDAGLEITELFEGVTLNEERARKVLTELLGERAYLFTDDRAKHYVAPNEGRGHGISPHPAFADAFSPLKR